jgi:hypothetical protein
MSTKEYRITHKKEIAAYNKSYGTTHLEERREYNRKWRKEHPNAATQHNRRWRTRNPEKRLELGARWWKKYPKKMKAQHALNHAIKDGRIIRPGICERCGNSSQVIEGHHFDYEKPLEVLWLCHSCHQEIHLPDGGKR